MVVHVQHVDEVEDSFLDDLIEYFAKESSSSFRSKLFHKLPEENSNET